MDMGPAYQKSVRDCLPNAEVVFDRFHVMKLYSTAIKNQRRTEFRKANKPGQALMKGCHYLLLKNAEKLTEKQSNKLQKLLDENSNMTAVIDKMMQAYGGEKNVKQLNAYEQVWHIETKTSKKTDILFVIVCFVFNCAYIFLLFSTADRHGIIVLADTHIASSQHFMGFET